MNNEQKIALANLILAGFDPTGNRTATSISLYCFTIYSEDEIKEMCPDIKNYSFQPEEKVLNGPNDEFPEYHPACIYVDVVW